MMLRGFPSSGETSVGTESVGATGTGPPRHAVLVPDFRDPGGEKHDKEGEASGRGRRKKRMRRRRRNSSSVVDEWTSRSDVEPATGGGVVG